MAFISIVFIVSISIVAIYFLFTSSTVMHGVKGKNLQTKSENKLSTKILLNHNLVTISRLSNKSSIKFVHSYLVVPEH